MRAVLALVVLVGCTGGPGDQYQYDGYPMDDFFPFDGNRSWTFTNTDTTVPYELVATLDPEYATAEDGSHVFTITYDQSCQGADGCVDGPWRFHSIQWSSDGADGTFIHSYSSDADGDVTFDPPLQLTSDMGVPGDVVTTTETDGTVYNAEFKQIANCPIAMSVTWEDCANIVVTDGDGNQTMPMTGDLWAVKGYNVIALQLMGDSGQWQLSDTVFTAIQ